MIDDFGLHRGTVDAALELVARQRVQAVGCQVGGRAWADGGRTLQRLGGHAIDIGLHLDLCEATMLPRSHRSLPALIAASLAGRLDRRVLRGEVDAQLTAFEDVMRRAPDFVDGHRHVHQLPGVRDELVDALLARYGRSRPWLRSTRRALRPAGLEGLKSWTIEALGARGLARLAARGGFGQNRRLLGVYDFRGGAARYGRLLAGWLRCAGDADLLMVHAGRSGEVSDPIAAARRAEFEVLAGPHFPRLLAAQPLVLEPMSRILGASAARRPGVPRYA